MYHMHGILCEYGVIKMRFDEYRWSSLRAVLPVHSWQLKPLVFNFLDEFYINIFMLWRRNMKIILTVNYPFL